MRRQMTMIKTRLFFVIALCLLNTQSFASDSTPSLEQRAIKAAIGMAAYYYPQHYAAQLELWNELRISLAKEIDNEEKYIFAKANIRQRLNKASEVATNIALRKPLVMTSKAANAVATLLEIHKNVEKTNQTHAQWQDRYVANILFWIQQQMDSSTLLRRPLEALKNQIQIVDQKFRANLMNNPREALAELNAVLPPLEGQK
jgi:hypothetical protein